MNLSGINSIEIGKVQEVSLWGYVLDLYSQVTEFGGSLLSRVINQSGSNNVTV
ncbi:hypothetical protein RchiOBHm_Chr6g0254861 [Rosa chinensis]|uniref:Uncharacterized protein n=1 Tax=Rosa chinensis TaxID=74649 RepID=A0A2P6PLQ7_ROSCH|nr:hypothetical protein RchiOBHm_Chr6g0254861 [Rosa chinensis]